MPEAATVYDKLKTGRIVLGQNSALGYTGGVITTKSSLTATDAYTVLLRDPIYLEAGLAYFVTFQTLTGTAEYRVDPSWAGSIKYDLRVTTSITQQLPEKAVFSLRVEGLNDIPKPFRVLTIAPTDSDDVVEVTAVEVNRKKWEYVDGFGAAINIKSSAIYFVIDRSQSLNATQFSEEKQAVLNALNLLEAYVQLYPRQAHRHRGRLRGGWHQFHGTEKSHDCQHQRTPRVASTLLGRLVAAATMGPLPRSKSSWTQPLTYHSRLAASSSSVTRPRKTNWALLPLGQPLTSLIRQPARTRSQWHTSRACYCLAYYNPTYAGGPRTSHIFGLIDNTPGDGIPTVTANNSDAMDQAILFTLAHG